MISFIEFFNYIKVPVTVLHVIAVVCAMGAAFAADILFNFYRADKKLSRMEMSTLAILSRIVWYGLFIIVISGFVIFLSDVARYLASAKFLAKMTIVGILIVNGIVLDRYVWRHMLHGGFFTARREARARTVAFICGAISIISWISALTLGMLHELSSSYNTIMIVYGIIVTIGIIISFLVERFEYEKRI